MKASSSELTLPLLSIRDKLLFAYGVPAILVVSFANQLMPRPVAGMALGDWYSGVLNICLPVLAMLVGLNVLRYRPPVTIRLLFGFFIGYLALATAAEALFLKAKAATGSNPMCPSLSDYFWWAGYALLLFGCLFFVLKFRRLRVPSRNSLLLFGWGVVASALLWFLRSTVQSLSGPSNPWALLSYPIIDVFLVALTIMLLKIYQSARLIHYWLFILAGILAVCVGDTLFFLGGTANWPQPTERLADSFLSLSYCFYVLAFLTASRLEGVQSWWLNPAAAKTDKEGFVASMRLALARGSYHATTIGVFFVSFIVAEKIIEHNIQGFTHSEPWALAISIVVSGIFRISVRPFEARQEHYRNYAHLFYSRVILDAEESPDDLMALEKMKKWHGISDGEAKDIELGLLLARKEDQFRREEALLEYEMSCQDFTAWRVWREETILLIRRKETDLHARESIDLNLSGPVAHQAPVPK